MPIYPLHMQGILGKATPLHPGRTGSPGVATSSPPTSAKPHDDIGKRPQTGWWNWSWPLADQQRSCTAFTPFSTSSLDHCSSGDVDVAFQLAFSRCCRGGSDGRPETPMARVSWDERWAGESSREEHVWEMVPPPYTETTDKIVIQLFIMGALVTGYFVLIRELGLAALTRIDIELLEKTLLELFSSRSDYFDEPPSFLDYPDYSGYSSYSSYSTDGSYRSLGHGKSFLGRILNRWVICVRSLCRQVNCRATEAVLGSLTGLPDMEVMCASFLPSGKSGQLIFWSTFHSVVFIHRGCQVFGVCFSSQIMTIIQTVDTKGQDWII